MINEFGSGELPASGATGVTRLMDTGTDAGGFPEGVTDNADVVV